MSYRPPPLSFTPFLPLPLGPSFPSLLHSVPLPFVPLEVCPPYIQLRGLGERCWYILALKYDIWWRQILRFS